MAIVNPLDRPRISVIWNLSLYAGIVACGALLWRTPVLLAGLYLAVSVVALAIWKDTPTRVMYLAAFLLGPAAEYVAVRAGAWSYSVSHWSLPAWLPFAWGLTAVIFFRAARTLGSHRGGGFSERPDERQHEDGHQQKQ